jgi:carbamoyl-phosphate synthase large subunit
MEHIEEAGVHSGDSACSLPPYTLSDAVIAEMKDQARKLALELGVVGLMNIQFAVKDDVVYLIEVNPRASRTVPFVAKAIGLPVANIAAKVMSGMKLSEFDLNVKTQKYIAVKEAVFPFARFPGVDTVLGPEMRSTGEVMGWDRNFARAFLKAQMGAGTELPEAGTVFMSIKDMDKTADMIEVGRIVTDLGLDIVATRGTAAWLVENGVAAETVNKVYEGGLTIVDRLKDGHIALVFNTTEGTQAVEDSREIRAVALYDKIPYFTTAAASHAAALAMKERVAGDVDVRALQG